MSRVATVTKKGQVRAPINKVFEYLADPENMPEVWPSVLAVNEIEALPNGGSRFQWEYKMVGMRFHGTSEALEFSTNYRTIYKTTGGIDGTIIITFTSEGQQTTVYFEAFYTVPIPLLGKIAEALIQGQNQREVEFMLANLKTRMEA